MTKMLLIPDTLVKNNHKHKLACLVRIRLITNRKIVHLGLLRKHIIMLLTTAYQSRATGKLTELDGSTGLDTYWHWHAPQPHIYHATFQQPTNLLCPLNLKLVWSENIVRKILTVIISWYVLIGLWLICLLMEKVNTK